MTQSHATDYTSAANYEASVNRDEEARKRILAREATFPLRSATDTVKGMLPKGPLGRQMYTKLHVYAGPDHDQAAQKPEVLKF